MLLSLNFQVWRMTCHFLVFTQEFSTLLRVFSLASLLWFKNLYKSETNVFYCNNWLHLSSWKLEICLKYAVFLLQKNISWCVDILLLKSRHRYWSNEEPYLIAKCSMKSHTSCMDDIQKIADAVQKGLYLIVRARVQQGRIRLTRNELYSDSFHAVLAWSCGHAKYKCCTATVTVVVNNILMKYNK